MSFRASSRLFPTLGTSLLALLIGACASEPPAPAKIENVQEVRATVESVDVAKRLLGLRGPSGELFTVQVSPDVRNLPQVAVGDQVVARYYQALAAELRKRGASGETEPPVVDAGLARAEAGEKPAAAIGTKVRATVRITAVDTKNHIVSFKGADGLSRAVPVVTPQGREFISKLKPGDDVDLTYTEAVAVSVEPAK